MFYNIDNDQISREEDDDRLGTGRIYEVVIEVSDSHTENDGIGAYEYWGQKCYDKGVDYTVIDAVGIAEILPYMVFLEDDGRDFEDGEDIGLTKEQMDKAIDFANKYLDDDDFVR